LHLIHLEPLFLVLVTRYNGFTFNFSYS